MTGLAAAPAAPVRVAGARVRGAGLPVDADGEFLGRFSEVRFGVEPAALRIVS